MRRGIVHVAFALVAVLGLEACGLADIRSPVADFMRTKPVDPPPPEAPPDVKRLVREGLESVFVASSNPRYIHVSAPHHDPRGMGWTACVRAEVNSANGRPMGVQPIASSSAVARSSTAAASSQRTIARPRVTSRSSLQGSDGLQLKLGFRRLAEIWPGHRSAAVLDRQSSPFCSRSPSRSSSESLWCARSLPVYCGLERETALSRRHPCGWRHAHGEQPVSMTA
jgi:hypothetical protein